MAKGKRCIKKSSTRVRTRAACQPNSSKCASHHLLLPVTSTASPAFSPADVAVCGDTIATVVGLVTRSPQSLLMALEGPSCCALPAALRDGAADTCGRWQHVWPLMAWGGSMGAESL